MSNSSGRSDFRRSSAMAVPSATATIRDAEARDIPRLLELYLQLSESSQHPEQEIQPLIEAHRTPLDQITADPGTRVVVLEENGRVIGTLALYILPNLSHGGRPFAIVENVVVDAAVRGGGYG